MSITASLAIGVLSIGFMAFAAAAQTAKDVKGATPLVAILSGFRIGFRL